MDHNSIEIFSIVINNTTTGRFFPGDVITGYILKICPRTQTKNVNITCRGKAVASLNGQDFDNTSGSSGRLRFKGMQSLLPSTWKEEYFLDSTICLDEYVTNYDEDDAENPADPLRFIPPLVFRFGLRLPKVLPPTCELRYGYISYEIKFEWDTWKCDRAEWERRGKIIPINIGPCVNLNEIPFAGEPAEARRDEKYSFLCFNHGNASATLSVDKVGYIPGEELHFKVQAKNETKFHVDKISVSLKQERTFCVGELKRKFSKTLATCDGPWIEQGDSITWGGQMIVPDVQWKFFWPCNLIRVAFSLQLKLITYKNQCNALETLLENSVSIIVGDIPIDPATYVSNFGVTTMGSAYGGIRLNSSSPSEYQPERMWLGVDQLTGEVSLPSSNSITSTRTPELYRCCHHETLFSALRNDDLTPSYSSVVIEPTARHRPLESPPPSYNEALEMFKPASTDEDEATFKHQTDDSISGSVRL